MIEENKRNFWLKIIGIIFISFICAFLAFYLALKTLMNRFFHPVFYPNKIEKMIKQQEKDIRNFEKNFYENPFEPKMAPMIVNLVKENSEYKIIIDLKQFNDEEKNINVNYEDGILSVTGELDKNTRGNQQMIKFHQAYYLNDKLDMLKMTKERKKDKYIITIPYGD